MSETKTSIEFVNHASVLINYGKIGILSDPWYSQSVFHNGWRLLYENSEEYIDKVLDNTEVEVRVIAQQFAWNIHYPGADGKFGNTKISGTYQLT
mgnify:CR=1 FL=1